MRTAWAVALALALPGTARAYVRSTVDPANADSPCLFWGRRTVPYQLPRNPPSYLAPDATYGALRRSFQAWTDATCSDFAYQDDGLTDSQDIGFNKSVLNQPFLAGDVSPENTVVFRPSDCDQVVPANDDCRKAENDDCPDRYGCWAYDNSIIALTTTSYDYQTGQIFDSDIELNAAWFVFTTVDPPLPVCPTVTSGADGGCVGTDLENTVTHEAGHVLGLGHSGDPSATMAASASAGEISKRTLHADDLNGLCAIYPSGQPPVTCNEPAATTKGCGCSAAAQGGLLGALALWGLRLPRRRRR